MFLGYENNSIKRCVPTCRGGPISTQWKNASTDRSDSIHWFTVNRKINNELRNTIGSARQKNFQLKALRLNNWRRGIGRQIALPMKLIFWKEKKSITKKTTLLLRLIITYPIRENDYLQNTNHWKNVSRNTQRQGEQGWCFEKRYWKAVGNDLWGWDVSPARQTNDTRSWDQNTFPRFIAFAVIPSQDEIKII